MKRIPKAATFIFFVILAIVLIHYSLLSLRSFSDFEPYCRAAERFLRGENLYDFGDGHYLFKYSPLAAMLFVPFALLPYSLAKFLWLLISWLLLLFCYRQSQRLMTPAVKLPTWAILLIMLGISKFVLAEIHLGQIDFLLLFLALISLNSLHQKRESWGGAALAVAVLIKPPLLLLTLLPIRRRRWRFCKGFLAGIIGGLLISGFYYGWTGAIELHRGWWEVLSASSPGLISSEVNQSVFGALTRWLSYNPKGASLLTLSPAAPIIMGIVLMAVYVYWLWRIDRRQPSTADANSPAPALLLLGTVIFSPLGWVQNYVFALPALLLAFNQGILQSWSSKQRIALLSAFYLMAVLPNYELMGREIYNAYLGQSWIFAGMACLVIAVALSSNRRSI
jgi:alpha-1,2-mannosyltransferase